MFKTIIVGVDGREGGRDALALAASLQRVFASELIAVHAFPLDALPRPRRRRRVRAGHPGSRAEAGPGRGRAVRRGRAPRSWSPTARPVAPCTAPPQATTATSSWSARPTAGASGACWRAT